MLEIKHLSLSLAGFALQDINVSIQTGEYFVLLGSSGSGKTVFLETFAGMYQPAGEIIRDHLNITALEVEKREIGFVYQDYALFPFLTVWDNIAFGLKNRKLSKQAIKTRTEEYACLFKLTHLLKRYPEHLSGGERQRVALARALVISPNILLLDEPLSALDKINKDAFIQELKNINTRFKTTVIHVTHDISEAIYLADTIGVMKNGKLQSMMTGAECAEKFASNQYKHMFN